MKVEARRVGEEEESLHWPFFPLKKNEQNDSIYITFYTFASI